MAQHENDKTIGDAVELVKTNGLDRLAAGDMVQRPRGYPRSRGQVLNFEF